MNARNTVGLAAALLLAGTLAGCLPEGQSMLAKAMSARVDIEPTYAESATFLQQSYLSTHDKDYVMWAMDYSSLCIMGGSYDAAREELLKCFLDIENRQDTDKETAAALSNESAKIFKGEPFERAMVCLYLGILKYMQGDYNNARIFCTRANMADATTEDNMADFRHDFRLAHYWLGRTYLKLGDEGNARVAFGKAGQYVPRKGGESETRSIRKAQARARTERMSLEKKCYEKNSTGEEAVPGIADMSPSPAMAEAPRQLSGRVPSSTPASPVIRGTDDPSEFLSLPYQKQVNLILIVETGIGPIKILTGENMAFDQIMRAGYSERNVQVHLDGHRAGKAFPMVDLFHQADTRGRSEKDDAQLAKGITQSVLSRIPYVGSVASYWNVQADHRYWHLLPGELHVFAAKVKPGTYTVTLDCFDANDYLLPRHRQTRYTLPVRAGGESIYFLHTKPEADNLYKPVEE